ncbi:MAG: SO_0444 family Cu/Zn efflux transporter [Gammaproteobacteria bacterium SHHR-1]
MSYLQNLLEICLEAAPWLLLGFVAAGLIKAWVPEQALNRWLGGRGLWPVTKAALIGAPLPLCSCGVLPAALGLRRSGASKGSTLSFMIATPETGVDSVALSYVMLGPLMALIRPIAAVLSAIATGLLVGYLDEREKPQPKASPVAVIQIGGADSCAGDGCCAPPDSSQLSAWQRTRFGLRYALVDMLDDLLAWLLLGLGLAALILTLVEPMALAQWGSGLPAMLLMLLIGIPMYICATASTPVAAAMLFAGVSPGTALVFLLAGPATNIATIGVLHKEMGWRSLWAYLLGISVSSILLGLLTDQLVAAQGWDIQGQISDAGEWLPPWLAHASALILLAASLNLLWARLRQHLNRHLDRG